MKDWGTPRAGLFLVALLVAVGLVRQWRGVEVDPVTGRTAIIEAQSVWRLRRIALAIETGRLAQSDSFLSFPREAANVTLPLYDELVALSVRASTLGRVGGPGRGLDRDLLMNQVLRVGPILGLLFILVLYGWLRETWKFGRRRACWATLGIAFLPTLMGQSGEGRLSIELAAALLFLLASGVLVAGIRAGTMLDRFTLAMVAGGLCGVGLVTSPLFVVLAFSAWCAFANLAMGSTGEERTEWTRAFLLFWITGALGAMLPELGGPWLPARSGIVHGWTQLCSRLVIAGAVPFLLLLWLPRKELGKDLRAYLPLLVLVPVVLGVAWAIVLGPDHEAVALLFASLGWSSSSELSWAFTPERLILCLLGGLGLWRLFEGWRSTWSAPGWLLAVWGTGTWLLAFVHGPSALVFFPAGAVVLANLLEKRSARAVALLSWVGVLSLCAWDAHEERGNPDREGLEILAGARVLQATTAAPGAANTVHPVHDWGVFADERCAPLVAWYAGRPCATLGAQRNGDQEGAAALRAALQENSVQAFRSRLGAMGLRWFIFSAQSPARWVGQGADRELMTRFLAESDSPSGVFMGELSHNGDRGSR